MKWDDLKIFLEVGAAGSFQGASQRLNLDHSTVSRRMRALEQLTKTQLFERDGVYITLSEAGEELYQIAQEMGKSAEAFDRTLKKLQDAPLSAIRLGTLDAFANNLFGILKSYRLDHPETQIELFFGQEFADLSNNAVDVVLRVTNTPNEAYWGRRLCRLDFAVYAHRDLLPRERVETANPPDLPWIGWSNGFAENERKAQFPEAPVFLQCNTAASVTRAVCEGVGMAYISCLSGAFNKSLVRLSPIAPDLSLDVWLLTHKDLKDSKSIKSLMDHIYNHARHWQDAIDAQHDA